LSSLFRIDDRGSWSGGGAAFLANWQHAAARFPQLNGAPGAIPLIPRNVPVQRLPPRPFVLAPQNAWPWTPVSVGGGDRARVLGLRLAGSIYARICAAQLRISSAIPAFFPDTRSSPVIHNVLDPAFESALEQAQAAAPLPASEDAFVCLGSATGYRNLELLVGAFADYKRDGGSCRLLIAGPPTNAVVAGRVSRQCADIPDARVWWGKASRPSVLATLAQARGVVLPSRVEASPLSLLEAVVVNPRIIASDIAGHREVMADQVSDDRAGFFDPRSRSDLLHQLHSLERGEGIRLTRGALQDAASREAARDRWAGAVGDWLTALDL
jgi:glycosyltransferase involved in cell wall biosynthesis